MSIEGTLKVYLDFSEKTNPSVSEAISRTIRAGIEELKFSDGTGDQAAQKLWIYRESLASTSRTWDLTALPVSNVSGTGTGSPLQSFAKIKILVIYPEGSDGQLLYLGDAASNVWRPFFDADNDRLICWGGSPQILCNKREQMTNPWTVDATHKSLKVNVPSVTQTYTIALVGV